MNKRTILLVLAYIFIPLILAVFSLLIFADLGGNGMISIGNDGYESAGRFGFWLGLLIGMALVYFVNKYLFKK